MASEKTSEWSLSENDFIFYAVWAFCSGKSTLEANAQLFALVLMKVFYCCVRTP